MLMVMRALGLDQTKLLETLTLRLLIVISALSLESWIKRKKLISMISTISKVDKISSNKKMNLLGLITSISQILISQQKCRILGKITTIMHRNSLDNSSRITIRKQIYLVMKKMNLE
jgi:hypothetical protein